MLPVVLPAEFTIGQLKSTLEELTSVPSERQKLLNLIKGKLPPDSAVLSSLNLKENHAFMLMGTPDAELLREPSDADLETVNGKIPSIIHGGSSFILIVFI